MPQIGWLEILIVVVVAVLIIGPKDFPVVLKKIGSWIGTFKNYFSEVQKGITDMENKDKVRAEAQQFYKSVCTYIKNEEYNREFFSNAYKVLFSKNLGNDEKLQKAWLNDDHWKIWLLVR